jgi:hypothetical protein
MLEYPSSVAIFSARVLGKPDGTGVSSSNNDESNQTSSRGSKLSVKRYNKLLQKFPKS